MLPFHRKCVEDFQAAHSGLLVLGKGLGEWRVFLQCLRAACFPSFAETPHSRRLVLVLNASNNYLPEGDLSVLNWVDLASWFARVPKHLLPQQIDAHTLAPKRRTLYATGGCFFVTSRIVVADLLNNLLGDNLSGIFVLRAHQVAESGNEAFAIRMALQRNPRAFVRAFSDAPDRILVKKLGVLLRTLHCKKVFLFPRFRQDVRDGLDATAPKLTEVLQPLSESSKEIQSALVEALKGCVDDLKRTGTADLGELSVEGVLFRAQEIAQRQRMESTWHNVSSKTKQLFEDVRALRYLLRDLARLDAVSFYEKLLDVKRKCFSEEQEVKSMWLFTDAAERAFSLSRARIYVVEGEDSLRVVLEPHLKIRALREVLDEVLALPRSEVAECLGGSQVVVLVRDISTMIQVTGALSSDSLMERKFLAFLRKQVASVNSATREFTLLKKEEARLERWREDLEETTRRVTFEDSNFSPKNCFREGDKVEFVSRHRVVSVHLVAELKENGLLDLLQPSVVVLFDPDVDALREVECFHAIHPQVLVDVFSICYEGSFEEQFHQSLLDQERDSFLRLIQEKAELVFVSDTDSEPMDFKRAKVAVEENSVIVDVRELKAALPNLLQLSNFILDARTLEVGDYILSPEICVERKSLSDLAGSFSDGRLFIQATMMTRHYAKPVLLIEFPEQGPFRLGSTILLSRLVLLLIHFPDLRTLWARTPRSAVELFREVQRNLPPPDGDAAELLEAQSAASVGPNDVANYEAMEVLKQLPGVTKANCFRVARRAGSLASLCELSMEDLIEACEGETNARLMFEFLHRAA